MSNLKHILNFDLSNYNNIFKCNIHENQLNFIYLLNNLIKELKQNKLNFNKIENDILTLKLKISNYLKDEIQLFNKYDSTIIEFLECDMIDELLNYKFNPFVKKELPLIYMYAFLLQLSFSLDNYNDEY